MSTAGLPVGAKMTTRDILSRARELLEDPIRWTKGDWARRPDGTGVSFRDEHAVRFCLGGAVRLVAGRDDDPKLDAIVLLDRLTGGHLPRFNDAETTTHADMLALIDKAIEVAR